jgi:ferredoxin
MYPKYFLKFVQFFCSRQLQNEEKCDTIVTYQKIWRYITMAFKITEDCIACGACAADCPVECITEGDGIYVIDADTCLGCGNCAETCPVGAPVEE